MSLLFDALKRAQDSDAVAKQDDSLIMDLSEPEAATGLEQGDSQSASLSQPEAVIPPAVKPAMVNPAQDVGALAAQSIFSATARQSRRIVSFTVGGLAILLLAGVGGFWYYQRATASFVSQPAIAIPPSALPTAGLAAPPQIPAEPEVPATPNLANAGPVPAATASVPQNPSPTTPANSSVQGATIVPAEANAKGLDTHGKPAPPEKMTPAVNSAGKTTASLVPLIEKPGSGEGSPAKKAQSKRRSPRQTQQREQPETGNAQTQPEVDNSSAAHIRLSASTDPLHDGYQALTEGRLLDAERYYQEVLAKRPQERDALLGLAVIAHRKQQTERASDLYRQVLREDPGNATATAALVNLSVQVDPVAAESRLKQLLDQKPTSPELYHALGSVLARQKRWGEAQQAFFRAFTLEPGNALYAYNLAVALDRLHKPATALPYYEKSIQILKPGEVAVDRDIIQRRVQELRSTLPEQ